MDFRNFQSAVVQTVGNHQREIRIQLPDAQLQGTVTMPGGILNGMVLFAHGSGSSRLSPRNLQIAQTLNQAGFATCLFDLLSLQEEEIDQETRHYRFDIPMLAGRLVGVTDWLAALLSSELQSVPSIGYFGASTGAAAALIAAVERPKLVKAVVSRGGRPDLAGHVLHRIQAPTLLLVGGLDDVVIELNRHAFLQLPESTPKELVIVPGAGHLFEEPGKLNQVAQYAGEWFEKWLP